MVHTTQCPHDKPKARYRALSMALHWTIAPHVAGAIKHQFDGHPVLWRMVPFLKPAR